MCGLFGVSGYGDKIDDLNDLIKALAIASAERGTDATGVAYNSKGTLHIFKKPKSAYTINFNIPKDVMSVQGHTRHATQGDKRKNTNNHPFSGKTKSQQFALSHNGVLLNDIHLRKELHLPKTNIETDSYIAVQLIESQKKLDFSSIKYMAEKVDGSFSFSILDEDNNIYLIKGDSPLSILHFPKQKLYVYASTDKILWKALLETTLFGELKHGNAEEIKVTGGDILKISSDGKLSMDKFNYFDYRGFGCNWWSYYAPKRTSGNDYLEDLKMVASCQGYSPDDVDELYGAGFSLEEIEDLIYSSDLLEV